MNVSKEFDKPEVEEKRRKLQAEVNSFNITPISFEVYKKNPAEKAELLQMKYGWKNAMKNHYGVNWKKFNNIPLPK